MGSVNYKVDLHTHSVASPDGGITEEQYKKVLTSGLLDFVAITDHNRIDLALRMHQQLGDKVIVGEEILTTDGEIIGLFLTSPVLSGQSVQATVQHIKKQGGLVYIPHPFETIRKGLHPAILEEISEDIDMIEVCNGRAFLQNRSEQAVVWARLNHVVPVASSDAHGLKGLGRTFTSVAEPPTRDILTTLLTTGKMLTERPGMRALLYPKYHRLRHRLRSKR